ncbi:MAG: DUF721 domain-containing protein [Deltaproteobacteria bacterium]|nr:DUF721 domain-containing protein [Deltaproteobacteria bacterium]
MRKPNPFHSIADILGKLTGSRKWDSKIKQYALLSEWPEIVGPKIAKHATPTLWRGTVLCVKVSSSSWLTELKMMERDIVSKIKKDYPEVEINGIRWMLG